MPTQSGFVSYANDATGSEPNPDYVGTTAAGRPGLKLSRAAGRTDAGYWALCRRLSPWSGPASRRSRRGNLDRFAISPDTNSMATIVLRVEAEKEAERLPKVLVSD